MIKLHNKKSLVNLFLIFTIISIVIHVLFYFYIIEIVLSPDYVYHNYVTTLFKNNPLTIFFFTPEVLELCSALSSSRVGLVMTSPNLYANIMGKVLFIVDLFLKNENLSLNITSLLQTSFGLLNIYYIYKISGFVFKDKVPRIFTVLILTNIQMFSYLINFLTYDNLVNLVSSASIYYLLKYLKERNIRDIFLLIIFLGIGTLTKFTFGVLLVMVIIVLVFYERNRLKGFLENMRFFLVNKKDVVVKISLFLVVILNLVFYTHIIIRYGRIIPSSGIGHRYCREKEESETELGEEEVVEEEQEEVVGEVFLEEEAIEKMDLVSYLGNWLSLMVERTFNIASHKTLYKPSIYNHIYMFLICISTILFLLKYRFKNKFVNLLLFFFVGYIGYLFFYRYSIYLSNLRDDGQTGIAGRYMFPVISSFVILFVYSFWNMLKKKTIPIITLILMSGFFIYTDKVFLLNRYKSWSIVQGYEVEGHTESIMVGESSLSQKFFITGDYSAREIGIYTSTYWKEISSGYVFNLFEEDCVTLVESIKIERIPDNYYFIVEFSNNLIHNKMYCFNIQNTGNSDYIILWYSEKDLNGYIVGDEERDILYTPILKYGF